MKISIESRVFRFKQPAGTSRGVYTTRLSHFVTIEKEGVKGVGECATLPDLSCDAIENYEEVLRGFCKKVEERGEIPYEELRPYPSMLFGLETAMAQIAAGGSTALFDTPFSRGEEGIKINGLVWMGSYEEMMKRMEEKLAAGFKCIKIKIGAIDFEKELSLIRSIRERWNAREVELRTDANGAFNVGNVMARLDALAKFDIHSIEQPIKAGAWDLMGNICQRSPIPVALDEELIGVNEPWRKQEMLERARPHYIIIKPSLHGGMRGADEWIETAMEMGIGSWVTSALESNVGLNAIAQYTARKYGPNVVMHQGLGTGMLFEDNVDMPLRIEGERLWYAKN